MLRGPGPNDKVQVFLLLPLNELDKAWALACFENISWVTGPLLLPIINNVTTMAAWILTLIPSRQAEVNEQNPTGKQPEWADKVAPTVGKYWAASHIMKQNQWTKVQAFIVASPAISAFIRCNWTDDTVTYAEADAVSASKITTPVGGEVQNIVDLADQAGFCKKEFAPWIPT